MTAPGRTGARLRPGNPWVGPVLTLSASSLETWRWCRRLFRAKHHLNLPAVDAGPSTTTGLAVHRVLELLHTAPDDGGEGPSCGDPARMEALARAHAPEDVAVVLSCLAAHAPRCPREAEALGHEVGLARFSRQSRPMFMVTGRVDALWLNRGTLEARDYKTGRARVQAVGDDLAARVQAWLLAPRAAELGVPLRIAYEQLGPADAGDPTPYEPEPDDVEATHAELAGYAAAIAREEEFAGAGDTEACQRCEYRSICPDSPPTRRVAATPVRAAPTPGQVAGATP